MKENTSHTHPPRTAMDVFNLLPEGTLCEVVENQLYMSPAPNRIHQRLSAVIFDALFHFVEKNYLGEVYHAPTDVFIEHEKNAFQPDILFVSNSNRHLLSNRGIEGAPDLVVEILSPNNDTHDSVKKRGVYERCGVKELWLVDPDIHSAYGLELKNGKYKLISEPSKIISFIMFDLTIDLTKEL
jgi:Uma2 family endonuclease